MKKQPLDVHMDAPEGNGRQKPFPLPVAALFAAIVAVGALAIFIAYSQPPSVPGESIGLSLAGTRPFVAGGTATASAFSSCGEFVLLLDGTAISSGAGAGVQLPLVAGTHTLEAKNARCESNLSFLVAVRECIGNQTRSCAAGACLGTQECAGGIYGECIIPPRICTPGVRIGCSLDGCHFGYAACNGCGNGFGPCLPRDSNTSAAGGNCSSSQSCG